MGEMSPSNSHKNLVTAMQLPESPVYLRINEAEVNAGLAL